MNNNLVISYRKNLRIFIGTYLCSQVFNIVYGQVSVFSDIYLATNSHVGVYGQEFNLNGGSVLTPEDFPGRIFFYGDQSTEAVYDDDSYFESVVVSTQSSYIFHVGDTGVYQPLRIDEANGSELAVNFDLSSYNTVDYPTHVNNERSTFHWTVEGSSEAMLTLSWNTNSDLDRLTDKIDDIVILGFNGTSWEVIPSKINAFGINGNTPTSLSNGSITSNEAVDFSKHQAFTLGSLAREITLNVSQAITSNGDGINDTWIIENITYHPKAKISVFSRWGVEVFTSSGNYQNDWAGAYQNNTKPLPDGSYYYTIDSDNDGTVDLSGWIYITQ